MTAQHRILLVHRRHARLPEQRLGYTLELPAESFPIAAPQGDPRALAEELGWRVPDKLRGRVDLIAPHGLVAPSAFERRYLTWLAAELGVPLNDSPELGEEAPKTAAAADLLTRLAETQPWAHPREIPAGLLVRRTETRRLEARQTAFALRCFLDERGGLDAAKDVLVLLPWDRLGLEIWRNELEVAGVPARLVSATLVRETPIGAWLLAAASLPGWSEQAPCSRSTLREVFDAPFWSQSAAGNGERPLKRRVLRELVLTVRRPRLTPADWLGHVRTAVEAARKEDTPERLAEHEDALAFSETLIAAVAPGPGQFVRLGALLFGPGKAPGAQAFDVAAVARARGEEQAIQALERVRQELRRLERVEESHGGVHPSLGEEQTVASLLLERVGGAAVVEASDPEQGVTLLPYELYDGARTERLVLAGLGEGGFPRAPRPLTAVEESWADALGLLPKGATPGAAYTWVSAELERQISLARVAISRCTGAIELSFATESTSGDVAHPGGLLALLVGGWKESEWVSGEENPPGPLCERGRAFGLEVVPSSAEVAGAPAEARSATEAARFAAGDETVACALAALAESTGSTQLAEALQRTRRLAPGLESARARQPLESGEPRAAGPYTGRLPGKPVAPEAHSTSALETYTQCPYKYFLSKTLALKPPGSEAGIPEATEVGKLVHSALCAAAERGIRASQEAVWDLRAPADEAALERVLSVRVQEVGEGLERALADFAAANPTAPRAYLREFGRRWGQALENWLKAHISANKEPSDATPSASGMGRGRKNGRQSAVAARVAFAEQAFGLEDGDPPVALEVGGHTLSLRGQIDRIDVDAITGAVAIRDYKTGAAMSSGQLSNKTAAGEKLQLVLYALAVEALAETGRLSLPKGARVREASLEFIRDGSVAVLNLDEGAGPKCAPEETPRPWRDVVRSWIAYAIGGIEAGRFDLAPSHCPRLDRFGGGYCDHQAICPARLDELSAFIPQEQPELLTSATTAAAAIEQREAPQLAVPLPPETLSSTTSSAALRQEHTGGERLARSIERDVFLSAGAGTGKTYNLVLRYLTALGAEELLPHQIVCVTFTRKAAAEMRHRVRQALFAPAGDQVGPARELASSKERLRAVLLSLSGAPISTLDALAARIVREGEALQGAELSEVDAATSASEAESRAASFVSVAFADALEAGDKELRFLLDRVSIAPLCAALEALVTKGVPDWARGVDSSTVLAARVLERWLAPATGLESRLCEQVQAIDAKRLKAVLDRDAAETRKTYKLREDGREKIERAVEALQRVRRRKKPDLLAFFGDLSALYAVPLGVKAQLGGMVDELDGYLWREWLAR